LQPFLAHHWLRLQRFQKLAARKALGPKCAGVFQLVSDHMVSYPTTCKVAQPLSLPEQLHHPLELQAGVPKSSKVVSCDNDDSIFLPAQLHPAPPIDFIPPYPLTSVFPPRDISSQVHFSLLHAPWFVHQQLITRISRQSTLSHAF
jgi:hypothetical protein